VTAPPVIEPVEIPTTAAPPVIEPVEISASCIQKASVLPKTPAYAPFFSDSMYTLATPTKGQPVRASDRAYTALRDDIVQWRLQPGALLAEVEQAERLGVSRTPLREALGRLTAEGLTTAAGGRGVVVTGISLEDIEELFELRETLESKAAALAAERGDAGIFRTLEADFRAAPSLLTAAHPPWRTTTCWWNGWIPPSMPPAPTPTLPRPCAAYGSTWSASAAWQPTMPPG
jgi:DNA-binding transcriptional regulator YhcF (GntR family)